MKMWLLVCVMVLIELAVLGRIRVALYEGVVPLNPVGWIGYSELSDIAVERRLAPALYWFVLLLVLLLALVFGSLICLVAIDIAA